MTEDGEMGTGRRWPGPEGVRDHHGPKTIGGLHHACLRIRAKSPTNAGPEVIGGNPVLFPGRRSPPILSDGAGARPLRRTEGTVMVDSAAFPVRGR